MRYVVGFACVLAALVALPQSVSAQSSGEYRLSLWQWHDEALTIALFSSSPTFEGYDSERYSSDPYSDELEAMELRVKRAKIGLGVSVIAVVGGSVLFLYGAAASAPAGAATGLILSLGGTGGTIASGILLRRRKRDRDSLREAHYGRPHRVQWDLAQSRLVF
jgi:hypothetical protein